MPENKKREAQVREAFDRQAAWCNQIDSPFTGLLMHLLARKLDRSTKVGRRILDWPGQPDELNDAVPLRLAGALHAVARGGRLPELSGLYPPHPQPHPEDLWSAVSSALSEAEEEILPWLDLPPQTNEVGRSAALLAGLLVASSGDDLPFALYELGASAGLNLVLDRYAYRLGSLFVGDPRAEVVLAPKWEGTDPPAARIRVVRRRGVDINPIDITQQWQRDRLAAYVWPDQSERLSRLVSAMHVAASDPPVIDRGDAGTWIQAHLITSPEPGVARVLMHSVAFQYFSEETRDAVTRHAEKVGDEATPESPFHWLRFEGDGEGLPRLRLRSWPTGNDRLLALGHAHAAWIKWSPKIIPSRGSHKQDANRQRDQGLPVVPLDQ